MSEAHWKNFTVFFDKQPTKLLKEQIKRQKQSYSGHTADN